MGSHGSPGTSSRQRKYWPYPNRSSIQERVAQQIDSGVALSLLVKAGKSKRRGNWLMPPREPSLNTRNRFLFSSRVCPKRLRLRVKDNAFHLRVCERRIRPPRRDGGSP